MLAPINKMAHVMATNVSQSFFPSIYHVYGYFSMFHRFLGLFRVYSSIVSCDQRRGMKFAER